MDNEELKGQEQAALLEEIFLARAGQILRRFAGTTIHARLGYLRAKWKGAIEPQLLLGEAEALLTFLRQGGCSFHSSGALAASPAPRGIAYRYDIHVRDIPGALFFADFHLKEKIPATFFLFWDYSPIERGHFRDYRQLRERISEPAEIGLHDSPVDAFLIGNRFSGNRRAYARWTASEEALEWLTGLSRHPAALQSLNDEVLENFIARARRTRVHFGPFRLVAPHGSELWQSFRTKLKSLEPSVAGTVTGLRAKLWLTPDRVAAAGLDVCISHDHQGWREVSDEGGKISKMAQIVRERVRSGNSAVQLLLHPYTWTGGRRDAELSDLLKQEALD